jgi:hypothetical protein
MDLLEAPRPAYMLSGEEAVATLDALRAEIAFLETYHLQVLARLEETDHTKETTGQPTAVFVASRHRRNRPEVQRELKLATALPKYPAISAALPDPYAPPGPDPTIQYTDTDTGAVTDTDTGADSNADADADGVGGDAVAVDELPVLLLPEQAEAIVAALEAVPAAAMVPVEDLQAAEVQMVEAARNLSSWDLRQLGMRVRDVLDTDGPEPAEDAARGREALRITSAEHGVKFSGFLANENAELFRTTIEAAAKPRPTLDGERDPRSLEKRQADGLSDVLSVAAGAGELPGHGGIKPHITVTIDFDDLKAKGRDATGDLQFGERLSAAAVRLLACDAEVIPVILGSESEPLDVGRGQRYVTKAMWRALVRRDKGCVVCGMPPRYSHAHHVVHWIDGGPTSVANLVFLCSVHHHAVHAGHYTVTITNGKVHVTRPAWADPPRTTRRAAWFTTPRTSRATSSRTAGSTAPRAAGSTTYRTTSSTASRTGGTATSRSGGAGGSLPAWAIAPGTTGASPAGQGETAKRAPAAGDTGAGSSDGNDPYWGEGPPEQSIRPVRAFPMVGDPPPLAALKPADFNPWGPEVVDSG